jgi:hypothetical protein
MALPSLVGYWHLAESKSLSVSVNVAAPNAGACERKPEAG